MFEKVQKHIEKQFPFLKEKKLLIACSGGLDSIVLSYICKEIGFQLALVHCNFSLRDKESDGDEEFVEQIADKLSVPVFTKKFDTNLFAEENNLSTQMAARDLRYRWFEELRIKKQYDYILTAHHSDDDMETFLINLSRGSGLKGLIGIPNENDKVIRPLLNFSRKEIEDYAMSKNIKWREDSSNTKTEYLRNKLRLEVIPKFNEATSGDLLKQFKKTQSHLKESQLLINDYLLLIQNLVMTPNKDDISIDIAKLKGLPNINAILFQLLHPYGFTAWEDISDLLNAQTGKQIFSKTYRLLKNRNELIISEQKQNIFSDSIKISEKELEIKHPFLLKFEEVLEYSKNQKNCIYIDKQKLSYPLELRKWKSGDVFNPKGMQGKKKLSKFFKDEKLSLVAKEKIWVLVSGKKIVWVIGLRADERFTITDTTKEKLKITTKE